VTSRTTRAFWDSFNRLPPEVQKLARHTFDRWLKDPFHTSLRFKPVKPGVWAVRVGLHYRALSRRAGDQVRWFWIGTHAEYDKLMP